MSNAVTPVIVGALYKHYNNRKTYKVICVATHTETLESLVVYQAMYGEGTFFCRPLSLFKAIVEDPRMPGRYIPRFELLEVYNSAT